MQASRPHQLQRRGSAGDSEASQCWSGYVQGGGGHEAYQPRGVYRGLDTDAGRSEGDPHQFCVNISIVHSHTVMLLFQVTQLKRTTEAGIQTGFVLFVDGEPVKMPSNELARDTVMPEGPPDDMKIMCALLTSIPRDGDNNSELWTTVDQNKTNVRSKGVMKLIQVNIDVYKC
jgi:hypothetical protein